MEIIAGKIKDITPEGIFIYAPYSNFNRACLRKYSSVQIGLEDGRFISPEQRKKAYALMNEISDWMGELPEYVKRLMKIDFMVNHMQSLQKQIFSLSSCDVTTAREFINYLVDFIIKHNVPTKTSLIELCEDIDKYVYACLMNKKCCICGQHAELHHVDRIGMGRDRDDIFQIGMLVLPLCRNHHNKTHTMAKEAFNQKYHLHPIKLTKEIGKVYKLTRKNLEVGR